jgi:hypothetical protein
MDHQLPFLLELTSTMGAAIGHVHAMNLSQMVDEIGSAGVLLVAQIALVGLQAIVNNFDMMI